MNAQDGINALNALVHEAAVDLSACVQISSHIRGDDSKLLDYVIHLQRVLSSIEADAVYKHNRFSCVRKLWVETGLRDNPLFKQIRNVIGMPSSFWKERMDESDAKVERALDFPVMIDSVQVDRCWKEYLSVSKSVFVRCLAIMLSTGSRVSEVMPHTDETCQFLEGLDQRSVKVVGVLKRNHFHLTHDVIEEEPIVLHRPILFGNYGWLRESIELVRERRFSHTHINRSINNEVKALFEMYPLVIQNPLDVRITSHMLRKIYCQLVYKYYGPRHLAENIFIKRLFGHAKGGLPTYQSIRIVY